MDYFRINLSEALDEVVSWSCVILELEIRIAFEPLQIFAIGFSDRELLQILRSQFLTPAIHGQCSILRRNTYLRCGLSVGV